MIKGSAGGPDDAVCHCGCGRPSGTFDNDHANMYYGYTISSGDGGGEYGCACGSGSGGVGPQQARMPDIPQDLVGMRQWFATPPSVS